jgi:nickel-type superoxide dismutase maturation protease
VTAVTASASVSVVIAWYVLHRRPFRVAIEGASMAPTLLPGDWALAAAGIRVRRGDVVVVEHPARPGYEMVKRLTAMPGENVGADRLLGPDEYWVEGDDPNASTDSRRFGPVRREALRAKVLLIYWPPSRRRLL